MLNKAAKSFPASHPSTNYFDKEWVLAEHYFGPNHCSRTQGPMIDYVSCNKSLIHFYRLERTLMFQKQNNELFKSCLYINISNVESQEDQFIDILSNDDVGDGSEAICNKSDRVEEKRRRDEPKSISTDPLDVIRLKVSKNMNTFGLAVINSTCDHQDHDQFHFVNSKLLQKLANTSKWIVMKLHQDIIEIIFNRSFKIPANVLFELMYQANLTKKILCHNIDKDKNDGSIELGVYGIPGLCDTLILGPCSAARSYYSLQATTQFTSGYLKTFSIPLVRSDSPTNQTLAAVWWRPMNPLFAVTRINAAYLRFLFKGQTTASHSNQAEKYKFIHEPKVENITCFVGINGRDANYRLTYYDELESPLRQLLLADSNINNGRPSVHEKRPTTSSNVVSEEGPQLPNTEGLNVQLQYLGNTTKKRRSLLKKVKVKAQKRGIRKNWVFVKPSLISLIEKAFILKTLTEKRVDLFKEKIAIIRRYCKRAVRNKSLTAGSSR